MSKKEVKEIKKIGGGNGAPEIKETKKGISIPKAEISEIKVPKVVIGGLNESPTKKPVGDDFVKYGEETPRNPFKKTLVVTQPDVRFVGNIESATDTTINIPLDLVSFISLQSTTKDIERAVKSRFSVVKSVEYDDVYKTFVAELKMKECLKDENLETVTDYNGYTPLSAVNTDILTDDLKAILSPNYKTVCTRGNSLVLVLGIDEIISNILLKEYITGPDKDKLDFEKDVTLSKVEYKNDTIFYLFGFKEMPKELTFLCDRSNFVAVNISCTNERAAEVIKAKYLHKMDPDAEVKFVDAAPIFKEDDGHNPIIKKDYINGRAETIMESIPMVKLPATYEQVDNSYKNPFMNAFVDTQEKVLTLDTKKIKSIFKPLIPQDVVMAYLVDDVPYLLVDTRILFARIITESIFGLKASIITQDNKVGYILHI